MTSEERTLITGLFDRLRTADTNGPAKDREAEEHIRQLTSQSPSAPYLLTQTVLVQEHALANAQSRIQALERQVAQGKSQSAGATGGGSFLSGLFGGHSSASPPPPPTPPPMPAQQPPPYPSTMTMAPSSGGGFLRNALTTAAGVAGGAMLFQGIENLLGHNSGPFGSGLGGGGFLNSGGHPEVVNNYYEGEPSTGSAHGAGAGDQSANPDSQDARFNDSNFDTTNPFDQPASDNSLFDNSTEGGSLDNQYDLDNTDADTSGNSDFVGGDSDGGDSGAA